jgi:hypothetical protein
VAVIIVFMKGYSESSEGNFGPLQNMAVDPGSEALESTDIMENWSVPGYETP